MLNGGRKYVYMCEDMVKDFYGCRGYDLVSITEGDGSK